MFKLNFTTENAAFTESPVTEIDRILHGVATAIAEGREHGLVFDENGNDIGEWSLKLVDNEE